MPIKWLLAESCRTGGVVAHSSSFELNAHQMGSGGIVPHWRSRRALHLHQGPSVTLYESNQKGRRPKDRSVVWEAVSELPGWQAKETASQLPMQGRVLNQRHSFETPRSRGVGTLGVAGPLTTSLRGLWVRGLLPPDNFGSYQSAATPEPAI